VIRAALRRAAAALLAAGVLAAPAAGQARAEPAVRPAVSVTAESGGVRVEVRLERAAGAPAIGAFQGNLRFDAAALTVASGQFAPGVVGAWNQVEPGRVRFAGASTQGIVGGAVLVLRVTPKRALSAADFRATLEEAFGTDGRMRLAP